MNEFQIYKGRDGWRWRLRAANSEIVAVGEAYTREADARRAVDTIKRIAAAATITTVTTTP